MTVSAHELKIIMNVVEGAAHFMELFEKHGPRKKQDCETYRRCADVIMGVLQDERLVPHLVEKFYPMVVRELHQTVKDAQRIKSDPSKNLAQVLNNMRTGESTPLPEPYGSDDLSASLIETPEDFPELQEAIKRMKNLV